jgi:hypothetical protein
MYSGGLSSETAAENWAESATMLVPHRKSTGASSHSGASVRNTAAMADPPFNAMSALALAILYIPKVGQKWLLHYSEATPWNWFKETVLGIR